MVGWLPAVALSTAVDQPQQLSEMFLVPVFGWPVPVVTCALGALGVIMARPFARRTEASLGLPLYLLVSAIMLILVQLWIVESRPGWLFAFVVAIGLGFSGYSMLELFGDQLKGLVRSGFDQAKSAIGKDRKDGL